MMIGTILEGEKDYEKAADYYRKALDINPDYAPAANNLAYHLATRANEVEKALSLIRKAKEKYPEDPAIADTLGVVYYLKGLYGNAETEFSDALKKMPDHPIILFHLGRTYVQKKEKDLARKYLKRAIELDPEFDGSEEANRLLAELTQ